MSVIEWFGSRRNLRLASGLVLFTYVTLHLSCHAAGLLSLDIGEACLRATVRLWHSVAGTVLLYGAATVTSVLRCSRSTTGAPCGWRSSMDCASSSAS